MQSGIIVSGLPRWAVIKDARRRRRRRLRRRAGLLLLVLAVAGTGLLVQRSGGGRPTRYAAAAGDVSVSAGLGGYVLAAQASNDRLWVMTCVQLCGAADTGLDSERLVELDASNAAVIRRLPAMSNVAGFTVAGSDVWVAQRSGEVVRINPVTGRTVARLRLLLPVPVTPHNRVFLPDNLSSAHGYVWVSTAWGWLAQINGRTGRLVQMVRTPSEDNSTTTDRQGTWVAEDLGGLGRLAPRARRLRIHVVMQAGLPLDVSSVLDGGHVVWALASPESTLFGSGTTVLRIDPRTARVLGRTHLPTSDRGAAVSGGALYLAALSHGRLYRVNERGVISTLDTPRYEGAWLAASSPGALWAATSPSRGHKHGQLLRISLGDR